MTKSLAQIQKQIDRLQREADVIKSKEAAGVVARIRDAIAHYGLTPADLFSGSSKAKVAGKTPKAAKKKAAAKKAVRPPKFKDDAGHTWSGRGKRPNWFVQALASGKTADELLIK